MSSYKICIIGLGYVGLPLALEFSKKFKVIGFDLSSRRVNSLNDNIDENAEINKNILNKKILFTDDSSKIKGCNIYIIAVPTPIDSKNNPNIALLKKACKLVGTLIKKKDIVVFESTVYPGCTRNDCIPIVSKVSKLKPNIDYFYGYSPERINPGDKIHTLTAIKKIISGSNLETTKKIKYIYGSIIKAGLHTTSTIEIAEAAKVIENTQRDLNIAFMNELSIIFNKLSIPTKEVLEASATKWNFLNFKPGLVGGHCIGVDPYYLTHISNKKGYKPSFLISGRSVNNSMPEFICRQLISLSRKKKLNSKDEVLILGLTFKENVSDLRNSKIFDIIDILNQNFSNISIYDPLVEKKDLSNKYKNIFLEKKPILIKKYPIIVFAVAHSKLLNFYSKKIYNYKNENNIVIDLTLKLDNKFVNIGF
jgi:UDP-N-acetyl-D-galactosamine dehydrogenase